MWDEVVRIWFFGQLPGCELSCGNYVEENCQFIGVFGELELTGVDEIEEWMLEMACGWRLENFLH